MELVYKKVNGETVQLVGDELAEYHALQNEWEANKDYRAAKGVRLKRDELLTETDWVVTKASEEGVAVTEEWRTYRADLRNIPSQEGFPHHIVWPTKP